MVAVIIRHTVRDFDEWKPIFEEHGEVRRRHGALGHQVYRTEGSPQDLIVVGVFKDLAGARAFAADPSLPEVMERSGVISAPDITFADQVEVVDYRVAVG